MNITFEKIDGSLRRRADLIVNGCPCCGHTIDVDKPVVDLNTNTLIYGDSAVLLTKSEADLAGALATRFLRTVAKDYLIETLWPMDEPENPDASIKVHACRLREKAAKLGLTVTATAGVGYRMMALA